MSEEEIAARIKELGLTHEEAVLLAKESGVDLESYLRTRQSPAAVVPEQAETSVPDTAILPQPAPPPAVKPKGIGYFGYGLFSGVSPGFEPTAAGPVDPDYLLGPGDVLKIAVWGEVEFEKEYTVDREGRIFVSTVGQVIVSGLTLENAHQKLLNQLSRSYVGLVGEPRTVWMDVTLASMKPKRIFVMGEVDRPGGYTVSSYATVFNSLYSIGGPNVEGSLRDLRLIRSGKLVASVDLYDYFMGNEKTNDVRVQNNDIIFVPVRGKTVSIRGGIRRPAYYELTTGEGLSSLIRFGGGLVAEAYAKKAQILRIRPITERTGGVEDRFILDVDLATVLERGEDVPLVDGDEIQIFSVLDVMKNYAVVRGSVWRPGRYQLGEIETVRDLVDAAEGLHPQTFDDLAHIIRYNEDEVTTRIIPFNLSKALAQEEYDHRLMPRDEVIVYSKEIIEKRNTYVIIRGAVKNPGRFPLRNDLTLADLIPLAGGYTEGAEIAEAEISRFIPEGATGDSLVAILRVPLPRSFAVEPSAASSPPFLLHHRDEVYVRSKPHFMPQQNVFVGGDMMYPGTYAIQRRGERLSEILTRSGGPTSSSHLGGARLYRGGERVLVDFTEAYYAREQLHDILMMGGDSIVVPSRPYTVLVTGEVNKPGLLSFLDGDDVSDYIDRAGGVTDSAHYALLTKPTGETSKVGFGLFSSDPGVPEGSTIEVLREPPPPPTEERVDYFGTIKDIFALLASVAAVIFIVNETTK
jgi:protein involved in polysaccharide export with SLBB domain